MKLNMKSTKAIIRIQKKGYTDLLLYHSHDSGPSFVGKQIKKLLKGYRDCWAPSDIAVYLSSNGEYEIVKDECKDETYTYIIDCNEYKLAIYKTEGKYKCNNEHFLEATYFI